MLSFSLRISSVNVTKSVVSCRFGHIYWRNPSWKTSFLCSVNHHILIQSLQDFMEMELIGSSEESRTLYNKGNYLYFLLLYRACNKLNGSALGVLKHYYLTKWICELLIGNSRFLIYNSLNQLLYYTIQKKVAFSWLNLSKL